MNVAGEIFINKAMVMAAPSDSQLALVLGHEVGNYLAEHTKESVQFDMFLTRLSVPLLPVVVPGAALVTFGAFVAEGLFLLIPEALVLLLPGALMCSPVVGAIMYSRHTSRKREYEAVLNGLYLMAEAGYDTGAATVMMETIGDFEQRMMAELKRRNPKASKNLWHETHPPVSGVQIRA